MKIKKQISMIMADFSWGYKRSLFFVVYRRSLLAGYAKNYQTIICVRLRDHSKLTMVGRL